MDADFQYVGNLFARFAVTYQGEYLFFPDSKHVGASSFIVDCYSFSGRVVYYMWFYAVAVFSVADKS